MCNVKELTDHMIEKFGSRQDAAKLLGVSVQELSLWCSDGHPTRIIPLDHFLDLNAATDDMGIKKLARERGLNVTSRDAKKQDQPCNIFQTIGRFSAACGHLAFVVLQAAVDGIFTKTETRQIHHAMRPVKDIVDEVEHAIAH